MLKILHMLSAFISISFFITRMIWVLKNSTMMERKWVKISPHINDTVLFVTAILLTLSIQQYPFQDSWLTAKLIALIVYILFGMLALKRLKGKREKIIFFILSLGIFGYIVMVATTRSASWFF